MARCTKHSTDRSRAIAIRINGACLATTALVLWLALLGCQSPKGSYPSVHDLNSEAQLYRGRDLAEGFAACGFCHSHKGLQGTPLSGGRVLRDTYGSIRPGNITVADSGIGKWGTASVRNVLRLGTRPDKTVVAPHSHKGSEWISDKDVDAITAYLRYLPATEKRIERRNISFWNRNVGGFFESHAAVRGYVPEMSRRHPVEYGKYLVDHVARCGGCHSKPGGVFSSERYLQGGKEIWIDEDFRFAPSITQSKNGGIGNWSEGALKEFFLAGKTPDGRKVDDTFCPVRFYANAPQEDIDAVVAYLRTVRGDE